MVSHIKSNNNCVSQGKLVRVNHKLKVIQRKEDNITYIYGQTRLHCALCNINKPGDIEITTLPGYYTRHCGSLDEKVIKITRAKDHLYYKKNRGGGIRNRNRKSSRVHLLRKLV